MLKKNHIFMHTMLQVVNCDRVAVVTLPKKVKKPGDRYIVNHDGKGTLWCGPAAFSVITGLPTSVCHEMVRKYRRKPSATITGVDDFEMDYALRKVGYRMDPAYIFGGKEETACPKLSQWLHDTQHERLEGMAYLIGFDGSKDDPEQHWAVVMNDYYFCSHVKSWVPIARAPNRKRRIIVAYAVSKK